MPFRSHTSRESIAACSALLLAAFAAATITLPATAQAQEKPSPADVDFFEKKIRPVLVDHCYECHSKDADEVQAGLLLDNRAAVARGGDSGKAVMPGKPDESLLYQAMLHDENQLYQMPPDGRLPDAVIADFAEWIRRGAPDPRDGDVPQLKEIDASAHWAFQPPRAAPMPEVQQIDWPLTDLDRYILAELEKRKLQPSPEADKRTWLRRVTFDLIGLPPTPEQVADFLNDDSAEAHAKVVDRLLASPHFGERWARYWLDVARFADTKGYVFTADRNYPGAHTYRDWVIDGLNHDMPYDQFIKYQLAADHMPKEGERNDLAAMGFLTLGRRFLNNQHDIIDDRIDVTMRGLQGLTVSCARCHDHKFDPIPIEDYYSLYGIFDSSEEPGGDPSPLRLVDSNNPRDARVFLRGNHRNRGDSVPRRFVECLSDGEREPYREGSGRKQLAEAIASDTNPLTARVFVNRVWLKLFGTGMVDSPSDFGVRTERPVQGDALDYLAVSFMRDGWSRKGLIRGIVLSRVYRQSSQVIPANAEIDPENRAHWRMNRRRLDFEAQRDSLLAVTGELERSVGGESVPIVGDSPSKRRTMYGFIDRQNIPSIFRSFDFASPDAHAPRRYVTTVPQQALYLLNNHFVQNQAAAMARRLSEEGAAPSQRIEQVYQAIFQRPPSEEEQRLALAFVGEAKESSGNRDEKPSWQYGYGRYDESTERLASFTELKHWTGDAWQAGGKLPDPEHGWVFLNAAGGHPGDNADHAAVRRYTVAAAGKLSIGGRLKHRAEEGDGVRGRIVSDRQGLLGEWQVHHGGAATGVGETNVEAGERIDFVVDCIGGPGWDSFEWIADLELNANERTESLSTQRAFHGPPEEAFGRWALYIQALMLSNEFVFVD